MRARRGDYFCVVLRKIAYVGTRRYIVRMRRLWIFDSCSPTLENSTVVVVFLLVSCVAVALEHEITDAMFGSHLGKGECNVFPQTNFGLQRRSKEKKDVLLMAIHLRLTLLLLFLPQRRKK